MKAVHWFVVALFVVAALYPAFASADAPALDCTPRVEVLAVDGGAPENVAPPGGSTSHGVVPVELAVEHAGTECDAYMDSAPVLLTAWMGPQIGPPREFTMLVTYVDADNDAPSSVIVQVDDWKPKPMRPLDPTDENYRDGVLFVGGYAAHPFDGGEQIPLGSFNTTFRAVNDRGEAQPVTIEGPIVVPGKVGAIRAPNPTNRLLIHPIANGPTLVPPVEILPPLAPIVGDDGNGLYSFTFELGPVAARGDLVWSVRSGGPSMLDGFLEGEPGEGYQLRGAASVAAEPHTGAQSVVLGEGGAAPAGSVHGALVAFPTPSFALVQIGGFSAWYRASDVAPGAYLRFGILIDSTHDDLPDQCLAATMPIEASGDWVQAVAGLTQVFEVLASDCETPPAAPQEGTLAQHHDNAALGLAGFLHAEVALVDPSGAPWPDGGALFIDDVLIEPTFSRTNADVDACIYAVKPDEPLSVLTPVLCRSDIGPNGGPLPAGATHANVWAHEMIPALGDNLLPRRAYLEPADFAFSYEKFAGFESMFPTLEIPPPTTSLGTVELGEDLDRDGSLAADEPVLASVADIPDSTEAAVVVLDVVLDGRTDGIVNLVARYVDGRGAKAEAAFDVQRFVNDAPTASLAATTFAGKKRIEFHLGALDADDSQTATSALLGGVSGWKLSYGDGHEDAGAAPIPSCIVHKYQQAGSYEAVLTIRDKAGATATASLHVEVGDTSDGACA